MEEVLLRFHYIGEEIFDSLDDKSFEKCKKVSRSWKNFIGNPHQKFLWIKTIKVHEKNAIIKPNGWWGKSPLEKFISGPKPNWRKLTIKDLKEIVNKLNSEKDSEKSIDILLEKYAEFKVELNATVKHGR